MALTIVSGVVACILCFGIYCIVTWHLRRRRFYELASKFDGPPCLPFIGNARMFFGNTEHVLNQVTKLTAEYPSPVRFWLGPVLFFIITDPEQIQAICLNPKTLGKGWVFERFGSTVIGNGLLAAPVSIWQPRRKMIQPSFNTKILRTYVEIFATQSNILVKRLERYADGPEFEIFKSVSLCTLDMICETTIGVKVEAQKNGFSRYLEAIDEVFAAMIQRLFQFWLWPTFIFNHSKLGKKHLKFSGYIRNFGEDVIKSKKQSIIGSSTEPGAGENEEDVHFYHDSIPRTGAFWDHLIRLNGDNGKLSDEEISDEIINMISAGQDTSAQIIPMVMLMLARHPDIQDRAYRELEEIYGNTDIEVNPVTYVDLSLMEYLERVIKETMRLFPTVGYITRGVMDELKIGEHTLPAGALLGLSIISVHRNEKYWPDPLKFDPDRFLPEEVAERPPHTFLAFSSGPRNCLGKDYAMMSMKVVLATCLRRYVFKKDNIVPVKDMRFKLELFLKPVDPITFRIERRHRN